VREYLSNIIGGYASNFVTIQCLSLVPWLCRGMQWVSISRSVALPRNAVGVYLSFRGSAAECSGCLSLVPWLCRGMQWVSISRSVALPRNAVGVYLSFRGSAAECSG